MQGNGDRVILVVDDEAGNREILRIFLGWRGYAVIEAINGQEAVLSVTTACPDLVIMDLAMPVMDGFAATRTLRLTTQVPIIACTAHDSPEYRARALLTGFNDFLPKPVSFDALTAMVEQFVGSNGRGPGTGAQASSQQP